MESFKVDINWNTLDNADKVFSRLAQCFSAEPYELTKRFLFWKRRRQSNNYLIEKSIIAYCYEPNRYISLEACMSNFKKCIDTIHCICSFLHKEFQAEVNFGTIIFNRDVPLETFSQMVEKFYSEKHHLFLERYSVQNVDMLPNRAFYSQVSKVKGKRKQE